MNLDFQGRCVLVTGASRGIGRAVAESFAAHGARIAVHFHSNAQAAQACADSLAGDGHLLVQGDLAEPDAAHRIVAESIAGLGGLDIVVNNAAVRGHHPPATADWAQWKSEWRRLLAANLEGPAHVCFWAARHMMSHGGGRMVNISSRGAFRGEPDMPAYGASKAGLNAMSQSLAVALAPHGIFVGVVAPGFVQTEGTAARLAGPEGDAIRSQSPTGRVATAKEVANAVLMLAAPGTEFMTGTIIDLNGASYLRT